MDIKPAFCYFPIWVVIGWALVGLVLYLSLTSNPPQVGDFPFIDKFNHFFAYSVLMGWFSQLYQSTKHQVIWAVGFCLMGVSLEILQGLGGHRYFEYTDMLANTAGVFLGWWLSRGWCAGWLVRVDQALSRQ
jgi:VanZ family protein